ncbi:MAG: helix-turn-helix transcriptional regulator [Campylobacterota bacterium]|nr:helix-turn-helix transcriptional regulator [Campylobacterota bacterium]
MLSFLPKTPSDIMLELSTRFRKRRKTLGYSQKELATRSGVSLGSLKRFEQSGEISLESLLKLAVILECLEDFEGVCRAKDRLPQSIEEL